VLMNGTSCGGGGDGATTYATSTPGQPGMNARYVHWDHLGSTRMMTDENGVSLAAFKYYPFGMEAESSGGDECSLPPYSEEGFHFGVRDGFSRVALRFVNPRASVARRAA